MFNVNFRLLKTIHVHLLVCYLNKPQNTRCNDKENSHLINVPLSSNENSLIPSDSEVFFFGLKSSGPMCESDGARSESITNWGFLEEINSSSSSNMYLHVCNQTPAGCTKLVQDQPNHTYVRS